MTLLSAFTPQERWLGARDFAARTELPLSTAVRIAQSLVRLGYLRHDTAQRQYCLAPAVLALGYGAIANSDVQQVARVRMREFAALYKVHVNLSSRDRLDLIVLESCASAQAPLQLNLHAGVRVGMASSPLGWALLAALPELERFYLLENMERRLAREWPRLRRRSGEAIAQFRQFGFCTSLGEWDAELGIVAAPLLVPGHPPFVLACVGAGTQMTRARVERELGPRLLGLASAIQQEAQPL